MQRTGTITPARVNNVVEAIITREAIMFEGGANTYNRWLEKLPDLDAFLAYLAAEREAGYVGVHLSAYGPHCGGFLLKEETPVDHEKF